MAEKFTTTEGSEVYINPSNVVSTEQTESSDFINVITFGLLGSEGEVTIHTNDGGNYTVEGSVEDVNDRLGK